MRKYFENFDKDMPLKSKIVYNKLMNKQGIYVYNPSLSGENRPDSLNQREGNLFTALKLINKNNENSSNVSEENNPCIVFKKSTSNKLDYSILKNLDKVEDDVVLIIEPTQELEDILEDLSFNSRNLISLDIDTVVNDLLLEIKNNPKNKIYTNDEQLKETLIKIIFSTIKAETVDFTRELYQNFREILNLEGGNLEDDTLFTESLNRLMFLKNEIDYPDFDTGIESINVYLKKYIQKLYEELIQNNKFTKLLKENFNKKILEGDFFGASDILRGFELGLGFDSFESQNLIEESILKTDIFSLDLELLLNKFQYFTKDSKAVENFVNNIVLNFKEKEDYSSLTKIYFSGSIERFLNNNELNIEILEDILRFNIDQLYSGALKIIIEKLKSTNRNFDIKNYNLESKVTEKIILALQNEDIKEVLELKKLFEISEFPSSIQNESLLLLRRLMSEDTGISRPRFLYENGFLPQEELTEYEIQALTGTYPRETLVSKIYAYDISYSEKINDISELPRFIEAPLLKAVTDFWSKGIKTLGSTANKKDVGYFASIDLDLESLSEENKKILIELKENKKFIIDINTENKKFSLKIKINEDSTLGEISDIALEFSRNFKNQLQQL